MRRLVLATLLTAIALSGKTEEHPPSLPQVISEAFKRSPGYLDTVRALEEAEKRYAITLAEQGFVVEYRGRANQEFDQDRNLTLTVDVPGLETEESRFRSTVNRISIERALPTGGDVELGAGVRTTDFSSTDRAERSTTRSLFEIEIEHPLFRANSHRIERERAAIDLMEANARYAAERAEIARTVAARFVAYLTALRDSAIRRLALLESQESLEVARARVAAGDRLPLDEMRAELAVRDAEIGIRENEAEVLRTRAELEEATGLEGIDAVGQLGPIADSVVRLPDPPPVFDDHPRIAEVRGRAEGSRLTLAEVRARVGTQVDFRGRHAWEGDRDIGGLTSDFQRSWEAGVTVTVPLYDGGARRNELAIARANLEAAETDLRLERLRVRREARQAKIAMEVAVMRHGVAVDRVAQAEEEVRIERARYGAGEGILTDLLAAQSRLTNARLEEVRARGEIVIARIEYLAAIGVDPYDFLVGRVR